MTIPISTIPVQQLTPRQLLAASLLAEGRTARQGTTSCHSEAVSLNAMLRRAGRQLGVIGGPAIVHTLYRAQQLPRPARAVLMADLSETQREVWRYVASGVTSARAISDASAKSAKRLSVKAARRLLSDLKFTVGAESNAHLVTLGWKYGVVDESVNVVAAALLSPTAGSE
ncbi:hypothetical protein [Streptomyces sp. NPDC050485]|uniref:hypothetical protein n=1 Tax=Streptomyces sp. NPDC050485 TaxID=3365617 RepID=UPI0037B971E9